MGQKKRNKRNALVVRNFDILLCVWLVLTILMITSVGAAPGLTVKDETTDSLPTDTLTSIGLTVINESETNRSIQPGTQNNSDGSDQESENDGALTIKTSNLILKENYRLGESVAINLEPFDLKKIAVFISYHDATYKFLGDPSEEIYFSPKVAGKYSIEIIDTASSEVLAGASFLIGQIDVEVKSEGKLSIKVSKSVYALDEPVLIQLEGLYVTELSLSITHEGKEFQFLGMLDTNIQFVPDETGIYSIYLSNKDEVVANTSFEVQYRPSNNEQPDPVPDKVNQTINQSENNGERNLSIEPQVKISGLNDKNLLGKVVIKQQDREGWKNIATNESYDLELTLTEDTLIRKIDMLNVSLDKDTAEVTVENIFEEVSAGLERSDARQLQKAFSLTFSDIEEAKVVITARAVGNQLFTCNDWKEETKQCDSYWRKVKDILPGKEYQLEVSLEPSGYVETGVATVNTRKPIYHPGETAEIVMVVLDTEGHLVPGAFVSLQVTDPLNITTTFSTKDGIHEGTAGIYTVTYEETMVTGNYGLFVRAEKSSTTEWVNHSMESFFSVESDYPFDILRDAPVTIDPWSGPFSVTIQVTSMKGYGGIFSLKEPIPENYEIIANGNAKIEWVEDKKYLLWENVVSGDKRSYEIQAPLVSPDLVTFGKATIQIGDTIIEEARPWYLAVDPPQAFSVKGTIFGSNNATQVPLGTAFIINDTSSGFVVTSKTNNPVPGKSGEYSETLNGNAGDLLRLTSWNQTYYGEIYTTLTGNMKDVNYNLTILRPPETNVTILNIQNNSIVNVGGDMLLQTSVEILGGIVCQNLNATLSINNLGIINLSANENASKLLGNVNNGLKIYPNWSMYPQSYGSTDITVSAFCGNEGRRFYNTYKYRVVNISVNDTVAPVINLTGPPNNVWLNDNASYFYYNVTNEFTGIKNCSLVLDGRINSTNQSVMVGLQTNFSMGLLSEGNHTWQVRCADNSSYQNLGNSEIRNISFDRVSPNVTLLSPGPDSFSLINSITFFFNATDTRSGVANCSLLINGENEGDKVQIMQNTSENITHFTNLGLQNWTVSCKDNASNSFAAAYMVINITVPDLLVSAELMSVSNFTPVGLENITITATIKNIGNYNATNVTAQFFVNDYLNPLSQLGQNRTFNLSPEQNITMNTSWIVGPGQNNLTVVVDPPLAENGSVDEGNESNNLAKISVYVTNWQWIFGSGIVQVKLDSKFNMSVYTWQYDTNHSLKVFVADSDALIDWTALRSLGRNVSNETATNDFSEADQALNLTSFNDSISLLFGSSGIPYHERNFAVFDTNLSHIPIINSSESGNFFTGILWDSSDVNPGQFNGTQDLVLVTQENKQKQGKVGVYDYEIRIPYTLRRYNLPNAQDSVTIYHEIT